MDFSNDPIAEKVETQMHKLKKQGVEIKGGEQYNRIYEAFYNILSQPKELPKQLKPSDLIDEFFKKDELTDHQYHTVKQIIEHDRKSRQLEEVNEDAIGDKVFQFVYNPMIHESGWITMSLHKTKEGAEKAMNIHKEFAKKKFDERQEEFKTNFKFGNFEAWDISEIEIKQ